MHGKAYCPLCKDHFPLLSVTNAAQTANVNRRTMYRYIEEGLVHCFRIAGKTYRVCSGCVFKPVV